MTMLDHITLRVIDFKASDSFYLNALAPLGIGQKFSVNRADAPVAGYGTERVSFFLAGGARKEAGIHLAFTANSQTDVDNFYEAALKAGGRDNGGPGLRPDYHEGYYAAFVFDPDGNNIEAVFHGTRSL